MARPGLGASPASSRPAEGRTPARRAVSGRAYPGGMEEDLFSLGGDAPVPRTLSDRNRDHRAPLAVRMRPRTLEEIVGQRSEERRVGKECRSRWEADP